MWSACTQEASVMWSEVHALKNLQYIQVKYMCWRSFNTLKWCTCTQEASIQWNKVQFILRSFNTVKWDTYTQKATIQWTEIHVLFPLHTGKWPQENHYISWSMHITAIRLGGLVVKTFVYQPMYLGLNHGEGKFFFQKKNSKISRRIYAWLVCKGLRIFNTV